MSEAKIVRTIAKPDHLLGEWPGGRTYWHVHITGIGPKGVPLARPKRLRRSEGVFDTVGVTTLDFALSQWFAQEILISETAKPYRLTAEYDEKLVGGAFMPTYRMPPMRVGTSEIFDFFVVPSDVGCDTYRSWITSWMETPWTEHLGDYLRMAADAVKAA